MAGSPVQIDCVLLDLISCGCRRVGQRKTIDEKPRRTQEQRMRCILSNARSRCYNPSSEQYKNYGARGIAICVEWLTHPESFIEWSRRHGYSDELQLDRIDPNGPYSPDNCRWITAYEQQQNKRNTVRIDDMSLAAKAREIGLNPSTVRERLRRGATLEEALSPKLKKPAFLYGNKTIQEWADILGVSKSALTVTPGRRSAKLGRKVSVKEIMLEYAHDPELITLIENTVDDDPDPSDHYYIRGASPERKKRAALRKMDNLLAAQCRQRQQFSGTVIQKLYRNHSVSETDVRYCPQEIDEYFSTEPGKAKYETLSNESRRMVDLATELCQKEIKALIEADLAQADAELLEQLHDHTKRLLGEEE